MSATPAAPPERPSILKYLYTHNPFYAISAVLMLYSIRAGYGKLEIGAIDTGIMMAVLTGYTLALAAIAVLIVRWGRVWEDARSILLLLIVLFLAVSISVDDLFATIGTSQAGSALLLWAYLFSAAVSEGVLWGTGVRLGRWYRIPYHLMLALFFVAPWWCTPELHPRSRAAQEWTIFMFPVVAAALFLCLLPAVRRGAAYASENGTPWRWPWFPWTAFGVIAAAVSLRSYALSMTYSLNGPIWRDGATGPAIVFNTIWGTYFLIPLVFAILLLLLESNLVTNNRRMLARVTAAAPLLLLLSLPFGESDVFVGFLERVVNTIGSPIWFTVCLLIGFYAWAWIRNVPRAGYGLVAMVAALSVIAPQTVGTDTLMDPDFRPFFLIAVGLLAHGLWKRSSQECMAATVTGAIALWLFLPEPVSADIRIAAGFHFVWTGTLLFSLMFRGPFADILRVAAAMFTPVAALAVVVTPEAAQVSLAWRLFYVVILAILCLAVAKWWDVRPFAYAFAATIGVLIYPLLLFGFRRGVDLIGRGAVTAFAWSIGMLLVAFLISAHKARWLPHMRFLNLGDHSRHGLPKSAGMKNGPENFSANEH